MSTKILLAENIKKYRSKLGWSQQKLATEAGLAITAIAKIEQGVATQPTIQTVLKISEALKVPSDALVKNKII